MEVGGEEKLGNRRTEEQKNRGTEEYPISNDGMIFYLEIGYWIFFCSSVLTVLDPIIVPQQSPAQI